MIIAQVIVEALKYYSGLCAGKDSFYTVLKHEQQTKEKALVSKSFFLCLVTKLL